eukprot:TRINITY_DN6600_c0_g1_i1.p1 TRINITY_DN6600_c0_g1~~TRINITY_DN6600_c0_g1_i1.p1  ORF type:complete len:615 (+),score=119.26 TRINITY_DN6600_c0_g1_i1:247-2091(+)
MEDDCFEVHSLSIFRSPDAPVPLVPTGPVKKCFHCPTTFGLLKRKYNCRTCGQVMCNQCSIRQLPVPVLGLVTPVRVCSCCFVELCLFAEDRRSVDDCTLHELQRYAAAKNIPLEDNLERTPIIDRIMGGEERRRRHHHHHHRSHRSRRHASQSQSGSPPMSHPDRRPQRLPTPEPVVGAALTLVSPRTGAPTTLQHHHSAPPALRPRTTRGFPATPGDDPERLDFSENSRQGAAAQVQRLRMARSLDAAPDQLAEIFQHFTSSDSDALADERFSRRTQSVSLGASPLASQADNPLTGRFRPHSVSMPPVPDFDMDALQSPHVQTTLTQIEPFAPSRSRFPGVGDAPEAFGRVMTLRTVESDPVVLPQLSPAGSPGGTPHAGNTPSPNFERSASAPSRPGSASASGSQPNTARPQSSGSRAGSPPSTGFADSVDRRELTSSDPGPPTPPLPAVLQGTPRFAPAQTFLTRTYPGPAGPPPMERQLSRRGSQSLGGALPKLSAKQQSPSVFDKMNVNALKNLLVANGVDPSDCVEKQDFIDKLNRCCPQVVAAAQEDAPEGPETDECVIYMENRINTVILECGHVAVCYPCSRLLKDCPICRLPISRVVKTFHVNR